MNEKVKQAFKKLCENYVRDINQLKGKKIAQDYFYNDEYEVEYNINGEWVATADILKAFDNMEELIKGKDEYIAKLCNDRAELKEHEKELIAEQHRLFDLAKEQENELDDLRKFAKLYIAEMVDVDCAKDCNTYDEYVSCYGRELNEAQFNLVKKMVEKYGQ